MTATPDSFAAVVADLRTLSDGSTFDSPLASRIERLDAEMREHGRELARANDQHFESARKLYMECEELRVRLAACEKGEVSYAIYQGDEWQAEADSLDDAMHYAMMYGQDGPVRMEKIIRIPVDLTSRPSPGAMGGEGEK